MHWMYCGVVFSLLASVQPSGIYSVSFSVRKAVVVIKTYNFLCSPSK